MRGQGFTSGFFGSYQNTARNETDNPRTFTGQSLQQQTQDANIYTPMLYTQIHPPPHGRGQSTPPPAPMQQVPPPTLSFGRQPSPPALYQNGPFELSNIRISSPYVFNEIPPLEPWIPSEAQIQEGHKASSSQSTGDVVLQLGADDDSYDFVINVDVKERALPLKLRCNKEDDPWNVARKFIDDTGLPQGYMNQIADHIKQITGDLKLEEQSEVKQVTAPTNFGIELLHSATHNNIELLADQGAVVRANSAILAFNSPVIHRMTTTLELTKIDMDEFSELSVRSFVESAYTGSSPSIPRNTFRDLNKIAHAFKVTWLQNSCFEMFRDFSFADVIPDTQLSYEDLCFAFDEAAFVFSKLKKPTFLDEALSKIRSSESRQMFIERYLHDHDMEKLSSHHLEMVIILVGDDVELIVQLLTEQLLSQLGVKGAVISPNCKYLLENCDLSPSQARNPDLFEQLFDVLQEIAVNEDLKWVLQLHRKLASKVYKGAFTNDVIQKSPIFTPLPPAVIVCHHGSDPPSQQK